MQRCSSMSSVCVPITTSSRMRSLRTLPAPGVASKISAAMRRSSTFFIVVSRRLGCVARKLSKSFFERRMRSDGKIVDEQRLRSHHDFFANEIVEDVAGARSGFEDQRGDRSEEHMSELQSHSFI